MDKTEKIEIDMLDNKQKLTFAGIALSALLAISCCIGPALFLLTGASISMLGSLSFLAPYKPFFIAAGAVFLGMAFRTTYIKKKQCACPADRRKSRIAQILTVTGLIIFTISLFFNQIITFIIN